MNLSDADIDKVWAKAEYCSPENEKNGFRKDQCGAWIKRSEYGNRNSLYGWEADHITPASKGGTDAVSNLRPLHWKNNTSKSDGRLVCVVKSSGDQNVAA
jgi:5-methylcytosine-specific restriction endonuclease McrA